MRKLEIKGVFPGSAVSVKEEAMSGEEKERNYRKMRRYTIFLNFLSGFTTKFMQYIAVIFICTGIYTFQPDILCSILPALMEIESNGITLQEAWPILLGPMVALDSLYAGFRYTACNWNPALLFESLADTILVMSLLYATQFDGDWMLLAYALCQVSRRINNKAQAVHL